MRSPRLLGLAVLVVLASGCDCGSERERDRDRQPEPTPEPETPPDPEPELERPAPPAQPAQNAPTGRPFGTASVTFDVAEGRPRAQVKIAIPEGAGVTDGQTFSAAIYFDNGPPIAARLTAQGGHWQSARITLPSVVKTAERTVLRIATQPEQTSFVWESAGVWQTAEQGPVTLDTGHGGAAPSPAGGPSKTKQE